MKEKIVIIFIALIVGLFITTIAFYLYQSTKSESAQNQNKETSFVLTPTPMPQGLLLNIEEPKDEAVTSKRTISVKGKTNPENTIVVSSNIQDVVGTPTSEGSFSLSVDIDAGTNKIIVRAIDSQGNQVTDERIITFSQEEF